MNNHYEAMELSLDVFGHGLRGLSDRWASHNLEELVSLAYLVDLDKDGSISWEDFYHFNSSIFDCLQVKITLSNPLCVYVYTPLLRPFFTPTCSKGMSEAAKLLLERGAHVDA
jgi:hypothetical protein